MLSRKGNVGYETTKNSFYIVLSLFIITAAFFLFMYVTGSTTDAFIHTSSQLEQDMIVDRILYNCFAYEEHGRLHPFVIDIDKFTKENLDACLDSEIRLSLSNGEISTAEDGLDTTILQHVIVYDGEFKNDVLEIGLNYE